MDSFLDRQIAIKINRNAKNILLKYDHINKKIKVTIPTLRAKREVKDFIIKHELWLKEQINKHKLLHFYSGQRINLFSIPFIILHKNDKRVFEDENILLITGNIDFLHRRVIENLKNMTITNAKSQFKIWQAEGKFEKYKSFAKIDEPIFISRSMTSLWGSCNKSKKQINLNWRLSLAPFETFKYVLAHELSHLRFFDHSKDFWAYTDYIYENSDAQKKWLRKNGHKLFYY